MSTYVYRLIYTGFRPLIRGYISQLVIDMVKNKKRLVFPSPHSGLYISILNEFIEGLSNVWFPSPHSGLYISILPLQALVYSTCKSRIASQSIFVYIFLVANRHIHLKFLYLQASSQNHLISMLQMPISYSL